MRFIAVPAEKLAKVRKLYEGTSLPVKDLAAICGLATSTFKRRVKVWGWVPRDQRLKELDAAAKANVDLDALREIASPAIAVVQNETLIDRVRSAVEREIIAIEAVLTRVEGARLRSADAERAARTLATLVKTLREVAALQRDEQPETESGDGQEKPNDEFRDLEEFRAELAERLDRLRKSRDAE
jgi:hypothetical protein